MHVIVRAVTCGVLGGSNFKLTKLTFRLHLITPMMSLMKDQTYYEVIMRILANSHCPDKLDTQGHPDEALPLIHFR